MILRFVLRSKPLRLGRHHHLPRRPTTALRIFSSSSAESPPENDGEDSEKPRCRQEFDFFGEPVSFLTAPNAPIDDEGANRAITKAMAALDGLLLAVVTKGKSCVGGGDEAGIELQSAHAVSLTWSEALRFASVWNVPNNSIGGGWMKAAPMLAVVTVAPALAQTGMAYVRHLDTLLEHAKPAAPGMPLLSLYQLAEEAAKVDVSLLNARERQHVRALRYLLEEDHRRAMAQYLRILQSCPGDVLAMSQVMDLAWTLGDKAAPLRAAGNVAAYWNERSGGLVRPSLPGHTIMSSYMALGFAIGGHLERAEPLADRCLTMGRSVSGAIATWANSQIFDAQGRIAEGISCCASFDGMSNYEGAGFLLFDSRLAGYGARFSLDREERGRGKSAALRLFQANSERILNYSGFSQKMPWRQPMQRAPLAWKSRVLIEDKSKPGPSLLDRLFGRGTEPDEEEEDKEESFEIVQRRIHFPSTEHEGFQPHAEDVLTWLPPTPAFLAENTFLLLRFTLNGTISVRNARWDAVRNSWAVMMDIQKEHRSTMGLRFCPLAAMAASLLYPPTETGGGQIGATRVAQGLYRMGELLSFGNPQTEEEKTTTVRELIADKAPDFWLPSTTDEKEEWKKVVVLLSSGLDGFDALEDDELSETPGNLDSNQRPFALWDFESRAIFEHAVVYSACKSGDLECLCLARAICSRGVTLRQMSPEEWWRYSIVLGLLGDVVGSEDALVTAMEMGSGQGARSGKF